MPNIEALRQYHDQRLISLRDGRSGFFTMYRDLAHHFLPRRIRWLFTPKEMQGRQPQSRLIDTTSILAARAMAAGMMSGITSPTRPWFKLSIDGFPSEISNPVSIWLSDCEERMYKVMAESNFYNAMAQCFWDLGIFGSAPVLIREDFHDVIRCFNPCPGEYMLAQDDQERVRTFYREMTLTPSQMEDWFGRERLSASAKGMLTASGKDTQFVVCHAIEPNKPSKTGLGKHFEFYEFYWERGSATGEYLDLRGAWELPGFFPRWDLTGNEAYGRSPAMDALPDVKQLQQETKRKAQALDKMVDPPLMADIELRNQPTTALPGGITYVRNISGGGGMKSIYQTQFPVQEVKEDIAEIQNRIKSIMFNDLFNMISQLQTVRTATEIDARREEKLVMLGPVLERFQNEGLDPAINRIFNIMMRAKLFPEPPPEVAGLPINVTYVSMLAEAQRAASTSAIERVVGTLGNLAGVDPTVLDNLDMDAVVDEYASRLNLPPKLVREKKAVDALRAARAQAQQKQQLLEQTPAAVKGAGVLSQTDVGGGQNALAQMLGLGNG